MMRDVVAAAFAGSLLLAAAGVSTVSRPVQDYLARANAAAVAEAPLQIASR